MATYGEVIAEIGLIIPKPGLDDLVRAKVNQAIRFISTSGYFWRDIVESTIGAPEGVNTAGKIQSIPITSAIRRMLYVQYSDSDTKIQLVNLEALKKRETCAALQNVAYLSGSALHIRHTELTATFNISYYTNPVVLATDGSDDTETNWVLDLAPGLVVDVTAAYVLNIVGDNEDSKRISDLAAMMRSTYIRDFMSSIGE